MPATSPSDAKHLLSRPRALQRLRSVTLLALLLPSLGFAIVAAYLYREEFQNQRAQLDSDVRIVQEQALKLLETNEMVLQRMLDLLGNDSDEALLARGPELHARLKAISARLPQVQGLFVIGADARMLASDRVDRPLRHIDYSDREFYAFHREARGPVFVTEQLVSRATGEPFFDVSRRRNFESGSFAGTVGVSLRPEYLTKFYEQVAAASPGLRVGLLRDDGRFVARWPGAVTPGLMLPADSPLLRAMASAQVNGWIEHQEGMAGGDRMAAFRRLGDWPLYVSAGIERNVVVARWLRRIGWIALFLVPTALAFAAMSWLALKRTREEMGALQRLETETAHRQRVESALMQSQKMEALGRLTGGVAHDFNNLLMIVSNNLYLIKRLRPDMAEAKQLAAIGRAVEAGTKLTRQLLAFARKQALLPEVLLLQQRLPELMDLLKPLLGASVQIECTVEPGTAPIEIDAAELELAVINLAINARDAMQGTGRLTLAARNAAAAELPGRLDAAARGHVLLEVRDSGPGIAPEIAARAFEPFYTTKPLGQGTGLGLAQVQALCVSTGGVATIDGAPGTGTRVRLYFRGAQAPARAAQAPPPTERALDYRVLLVEDNAAVADATREVLQAMGCRVQQAASAAHAMAALDADAEGFDVVLSDIEMAGGIDGIELAGRLAAQHPTVPVVLMTGYAVRLEQAVQQRLEVLPKPCEPALLAEALAKAARKRRAHAAA